MFRIHHGFDSLPFFENHNIHSQEQKLAISIDN